MMPIFVGYTSLVENFGVDPSFKKGVFWCIFPEYIFKVFTRY